MEMNLKKNKNCQKLNWKYTILGILFRIPKNAAK